MRSIRSHYDAYFDPTEREAITVTSYRMIQNLPEMALDWNWGLVILDEAHEKLRTKTTVLFKKDTEAWCVRELLAKRAKRAVVITGSPAISKAVDVFAIVDALKEGCFGCGPDLPSPGGGSGGSGGSGGARRRDILLEVVKESNPAADAWASAIFAPQGPVDAVVPPFAPAESHQPFTRSAAGLVCPVLAEEQLWRGVTGHRMFAGGAGKLFADNICHRLHVWLSGKKESVESVAVRDGNARGTSGDRVQRSQQG